MRADDSLFNYSQLVREIQRCCQDRTTGTMLIMTPDNTVVRIIFDQGQIVSLTFGSKHGQDAIPLIANIKGGRVKFSAAKAGGYRDRGSTPATSAILRMLGGDLAPVADPTSGTQAAGPGYASFAIQVIENAAIDILGPMGALVMEECQSKTGGDVKKLIDAVAAEIRDPEKNRHFKDQVAKKLLRR